MTRYCEHLSSSMNRKVFIIWLLQPLFCGYICNRPASKWVLNLHIFLHYPDLLKQQFKRFDCVEFHPDHMNQNLKPTRKKIDSNNYQPAVPPLLMSQSSVDCNNNMRTFCIELDKPRMIHSATGRRISMMSGWGLTWICMFVTK